MKIQTTIDIPDEVIFDVLVTALEGGSNYWYEFREDTSRILKDYDESGDSFSNKLWRGIKAGEVIPVYDIEGDGGDDPIGFLSLRRVQAGLETLQQLKRPEFAVLISADPVLDADGADVVFQYWVLGEIVYG